MRIIAGAFRGKKIIPPEDKKTRPLKDLVKESIFNIINHSNKLSSKIEDAIILDLFSGVGTFGLESLSRGAKFVTFVEKYVKVLSILKKNLDNLKLINKFDIIEEDILENFDNIKFNHTFDIIFIDPPYKENDINQILKIIINKKILKNEGIIIIHRHKKELNNFPDQLKIIEEKKYGIAKIIFAKI